MNRQMMDGWMGKWKCGWMEGWMDGWLSGGVPEKEEQKVFGICCYNSLLLPSRPPWNHLPRIQTSQQPTPLL